MNSKPKFSLLKGQSFRDCSAPVVDIYGSMQVLSCMFSWRNYYHMPPIQNCFSFSLASSSISIPFPAPNRPPVPVLVLETACRLFFGVYSFPEPLDETVRSNISTSLSTDHFDGVAWIELMLSMCWSAIDWRNFGVLIQSSSRRKSTFAFCLSCYG